MAEIILAKYRKERNRLYEEGRKISQSKGLNFMNEQSIKGVHLWLIAERIYFDAVLDYFGPNAQINTITVR